MYWFHQRDGNSGLRSLSDGNSPGCSKDLYGSENFASIALGALISLACLSSETHNLQRVFRPGG